MVYYFTKKTTDTVSPQEWGYIFVFLRLLIESIRPLHEFVEFFQY